MSGEWLECGSVPRASHSFVRMQRRNAGKHAAASDMYACSDGQLV